MKKEKFNPLNHIGKETPKNAANNNVAVNQPDFVFNNLLKWIEKQDTFTNGKRNNYVHKLARACNTFGVDYTYCLNECVNSFAKSDFTQSEITDAVKSAYKYTNEHNTKKFDVNTEYSNTNYSNTSALIVKPQEQPFNEDDIFAKYAHLKISANTPIETPTPIVSINDCPISTEGNLTVFSGNIKSGKTAVCSVIIAGAIKLNEVLYNGFENIIIADNSEHKAVIHFDTEQAKHHHYKNLKSILKRAGRDTEPDCFQSYNIRELDIKEYQTICNDIFEASYRKFKGIHLAVIDGAADFIKSVNDEEESNKIVHYFEQLAIKYKTPIILIIHFNPNSEKQRGHLGSQLQRKAESVIAIKKEGEMSCIEPQWLRSAGNSDIPLIQFQYDKEKGYHTYCGIKTKPDKEQMNIDQLKQWANAVFSREPIKHKVAVEKLMNVSGKKSSTVKINIKAMLDLEIIFKNDDGQYLLNDENANKDAAF